MAITPSQAPVRTGPSPRPPCRRRRTLAGAAALLLAHAGAQALPVYWLGGDGVWGDDASRWSGGQTPTWFSDVVIDGQPGRSSWVTVDGGSAAANLSVTSGDRLTIQDYLAVYGNRVENTGRIELVSVGGVRPILALQSDVTITGSGATELQGGYIPGGGHTLTIANGQALGGNGNLGYWYIGDIGVVNQGTLYAAQGLLQLNLGNHLTFDNRLGTVRIDAGAALQILAPTGNSGNFDSLVLGGRFTGQGNARIGSGVTLVSPTFSGSLATAGATALNVSGTVTNEGILSGGMTLFGNTVLTGSGREANNFSVHGKGFDLTIDRGHTVAASGELRDAGTLVNLGLLQVPAGGTLTLWADRIDNRAGSIEVGDGARLQLYGNTDAGRISTPGRATLSASGVWRNASLSGQFDVAPGSNVSIDGTLTNSGTLRFSAFDPFNNPTVVAVRGSLTLAGAGQTVAVEAPLGISPLVFSSGAQLTIGEGHTLRIAGTVGSDLTGYDVRFVNRGTLVADAAMPVTLHAGGGFDNQQGSIQVQDGGSLILANGTISGGRVQGQGSAAISMPIAWNGAGGSTPVGWMSDLSFEGQLRVGAGQVLNLAGSIANHGTLTVDGQVLSKALQFDNRTGTVVINPGGGMRVNNGRLLLADGSTLVFSGDSGFNASSIRATALDAGMADASRTVPWGQLSIAGDVTLDGVLHIVAGGATAQVGESFQLISAAGHVSGAFDQVLMDGYQVSTRYTGQGVVVTVLSVAAVPEPQATWLMLAGLAGLAGLRGVRRSREGLTAPAWR